MNRYGKIFGNLETLGKGDTMEAVKLIPALKQTIWGGQRLKKLYDGTGMENIAESWVLSCHPAGPSVVADGEDAGRTLPDVLQKAGKAAVGTRSPEGDFPLLIKLIDAADRLSLQVHPDNAYAREHENEYGKTECWYILDSEPGAELIFGMQDALSREQFRQSIADNTLLSHVRHVQVKKGDTAFIPAGTLHGIGKGILLAEVQQSSDTTYRVYDYGRLQNGKPRQLHIDQAVAVTNLSPSDASLVPMGKKEEKDGYTEQLLSACQYFVMKQIEIDSRYMGVCDDTSFTSLVVLAGEGTYEGGETTLSLKTGDSLFIPAATGQYTVTGHLQLLHTTLGKKDD